MKAMGMFLALSALGGMVQGYASKGQLNVELTQQIGKCTGVVKDASGMAIIGASVIVKGTTHGTVTDYDGNFTLEGVKTGDVIQVSFVGYQTQDVKWNGQPLDIVLKEDAKTLDEVVVIGYGTVRKADMAGAVSVMDSKAFKAQPITQVSDALQGRVAGVNVVSDGIPGGSVKIRIRGTNSINKSNDPLYVVDGMVRESGLEGINPEDIQSMQILKDASSTAIYGSRGANGVVIITTKSGMNGQSSITLDTSWGFSEATRLPKKMNAQTYAKALVEYNGISELDVEDYLNGTNPGVDYIDEIFRTGLVQNYKLVFSKGMDGLQTYVSGNYMQQEGTIEKTSYERYAAKANIKARMTDWMDLTLDFNASRSIGKGIGGLELSGANPLWVAFNYSPSMELLDAEGNYNYDPYSSIQNNPLGMVRDNPQERRRDVVSGHVDLRFQIIDGLTFTTSNGIDYYNLTSYGFSPLKINSNGSNNMSNNNQQRVLLQSSNNFTYDKTWDKHHLTATAVWEATQSNTRAMGISGQNIQVESVGWWNVANAMTRNASNSYSDWSMLSGVGRVIYNYDNRYMFTGTFRADGSSRFTNNKWGYFPSVAFAWTASNEKFMEKYRDVISNLKLRTSYGVIGNQDIAPYSTLALMSQTTTYFGSDTGVTGYWANTLATPDIKWEKTNQFDIGFDLGLWDNRLTLSFDYFDKRTTDALLSTSLPNYLGGTSYLINAGEVSNKGFEFAISADVFQNQDFDWTTSLNGTYLKNKVVKLTAQEPRLYSGVMPGICDDGTNIITEGEAIGSFYGYRWAGIDSDGYDTYYKSDGSTTRNPDPTTDRVVLGRSTPDFTLGWNNSLRYKNWSLNVFFNSSFGAKRLNVLRFAMNEMIGNSRMFTEEGHIEEIGKLWTDPSRTENNVTKANSSKYLENADYFRCENFSLSYNLPKSWTKFADVLLSFSVQNLFTITSYKGSNPAGFSFSSSAGDQATGVDTGTSPAPRTWTFGARMTF
jgi:TonB-linked SusC/RagA family outer membrane protein